MFSFAQTWNIGYIAQLDRIYKSHNTPVPCPIIHHFVTEMCTCVHISVIKWCIVGHFPMHCGISEMGQTVTSAQSWLCYGTLTWSINLPVDFLSGSIVWWYRHWAGQYRHQWNCWCFHDEVHEPEIWNYNKHALALICLSENHEFQEFSWCRLCRHWWHRRSSLWQPVMPTVATLSFQCKCFRYTS